jgi:aryl-alcohol dehydrogenase-like predicted oxidoreductase
MSREDPFRASRRRVIQAGLLAGLGSMLPAGLPAADRASRAITKAIPSTGERIPVIGLGTANQYGRAEYGEVRDILKRMHELEGTVIDTAALYRGSEETVGNALSELGLLQKMFIATKLNAPGASADAPGASADAAGGLESFERSLQRLGKVDLLFVHFPSSVDAMMPLLVDLKHQKRVRYIGITTVNPLQHAQVAEYMRKYPLDFVQVEYSLGDRAAEMEILPLAQQRRIAVMAAYPFGGGGSKSLFNQVANRSLPDWASEFGIASWGQFFLKYVVSHPALTCAIPGSTKLSHLEDNQAAGRGRLPDFKTRKRMEEFWQTTA